MKKRMQKIFQVIIILIGIMILVYPALSTYLSEKNGSRAIGVYDDFVKQVKEDQRQKILQSAIDYNNNLAKENYTGIPLTDENGIPVCHDDYWDILDLTGNGMMGYIVLPTLNEKIPIYHGTKDSTLRVGVGHVINTSFPVGGASTHAALSGHNGLPSASLFTNLDQMEIGDYFYIHVVDQVLAYKVDQILIVEPNQSENLAIVDGKDYVTLITCTPYGINSHRLLVRGSRVPYTESKDESSSNSKGNKSLISKIPMQYRHLMIGLCVIICFILLRFIILKIIKYLSKRRN